MSDKINPEENGLQPLTQLSAPEELTPSLDNIIALPFNPTIRVTVASILERVQMNCKKGVTLQERRFVRALLVCGLFRLHGMENWVLQSMTLADFHGAKWHHGFPIVSVQSTKNRIVSFHLDPDIFAFLDVYVRYVRGSLPGDENPNSALVFGADSGKSSANLNCIASRFAETNQMPHYAVSDIRRAWLRAAHLDGDLEGVVGLVEAHLDMTSRFTISEDAVLNLDRMEEVAKQGAAMQHLINKGLSRINCGVVQPLVHSVEERAVANLKSKTVSSTTKIPRPSKIRAKLKKQGVLIDPLIAKSTAKHMERNRQEQFIRDWLKDRQSLPTRVRIRKFVSDNKLSRFTEKSRAVTIQNWWQPPPPSLGKRTENAAQKMVLDAMANERILHNIETEWPGLAVKTYFPGRGRGILTTVPFEYGDIVCHYHGTVISGDQARDYIRQQLKDRSADTSYLVEWKDKELKYCIDAQAEDGKQGRLINHSARHPNLKKMHRVINGNVYLLFTASEDIPVGTELLYDYGDSPGETKPDWLKAAYCPCTKCNN